MLEILLLYLEQLILYQLGANVCFNLKLRMPWMQLMGAGVCVGMVYVTEMPDSICVYVSAWVVTFLVMKEAWKDRLSHFVILLIFLTGLEEILDFVGRFYFGQMDNGVWKNFVRFLMVSIFLLTVWLARKRKTVKGMSMEFVTSFSSILLAVVLVTLFLTILGLDYAYSWVDNEIFRIFVKVVVGVSLLAVWLLGLFLFYMRFMNKNLQEVQKQEKELYVARENYYELLLQREEDTRKFRHDLNNHLICIRELVQERNWENLDDYLAAMYRQTKKFEKKYDTGNKILDALTSYLLMEIDEDVMVQLEGTMYKEVIVDTIDLCTIYANLLKNAVEEIGRCNRTGKRRLFIGLWGNGEWIEIEIKNSVSGEVDLSKTSKNDKENHGYGIRNVKEKVEELKGKIKFIEEDGYFTVNVILPNN